LRFRDEDSKGLREREKLDELEVSDELVELEGPDELDELEEPDELDELEGPDELDELEEPDELDELEGPDQLVGLEYPYELDELEEPDELDELKCARDIARARRNALSSVEVQRRSLSSSVSFISSFPRGACANLRALRDSASASCCS
jgi:hypothetical protein